MPISLRLERDASPELSFPTKGDLNPLQELKVSNKD